MFFDWIVHDLLLAKLSTYGFYHNSLELINSFLSGRKFRAKKGCSYSLITIYLWVLLKDQSRVLFLHTYTCANFFYAIVNGIIIVIIISLFSVDLTITFTKQ